MSTPFVCRWGIVGTGMISSGFVGDLAADPSKREVSDVAHAFVVVGSRDQKKAQEFIEKVAPKGGWAQQAGHYPSPTQAVGSYEEVYSHPEVDIVYIGTPHPMHFEHAKAALEAGKGVLVEKPATLNANEVKILIELAKEKNLFFMEALWTRFFPIAYKFQELLHKDKVIGDIHHVQADFGLCGFNTLPVTHRIFNADLAGGCQLDLGPYPLVWGMMALYEHPENNRETPSNIFASSMPDPRTGVDLMTTVVLDFKKINARANLTCNNLVSASPESCVRVLGTKGEVSIAGPATCRPTTVVVRKYTGPDTFRLASTYDETRYDYPVDGTGLFFEADETARQVRDGKIVSERYPPEMIHLAMQIMDEWRKQTNYKYPAGLEKA